MQAQWDAKRNDAMLGLAALLEKIVQRNKQFKGQKQQDSHEVLRVILEAFIEEEFERVGDSKPSPLKRLLEGQIVSNIVCRVCKNRSETVEPFLDIPQPLMYKLPNADFSKEHYKHTTGESFISRLLTQLHLFPPPTPPLSPLSQRKSFL
eukprot:IDg5886t1